MGIPLLSLLHFSSIIPTSPEAPAFQILPLCPIAKQHVLGCLKNEITALSIVAGAWDLLLCVTVWFVLSLKNDSSG